MLCDFSCFCLLGFSAPFVMSMSFFLDAFGNPFSYFPSFFHPHPHGLRTKSALHKTNKKFFSPKRSVCLFLFVKMTFPLSTQSVLSSISTPDSFSYFLLQIHLTVNFSWATMVSQVPSSFFEVLLLFFLTLGILFVTE